MPQIGIKRDRRPARSRNAIIDREGLSILIAYLIEVAGSYAAAARACQIPSSRALLYELINQRRVELAQKTVWNLQRGLDAFGIPFRVEDLLSSPLETIARNAYQSWLAKAAGELVLEPAEGNERPPRLRPSGARRREFHRLMARFERLRPTELERLIGRATKTLGHTRERVAFAVYRVFEPLLQVRISGYVEIGAEELGDTDFIGFVVAGLKREALLLKRSPDPNRLRDGDSRRRSRIEQGLVDSSNRYVQLLESPRVRRKRWGIADELGGGQFSERPFDPDIGGLVKAIPERLWGMEKALAPQKVAIDPSVETYRTELALAKKRRAAKAARRVI